MLSGRPVRVVLGFLAIYVAAAVPFLLGRSLGSRQFMSLPSTFAWAIGIPLFFSALLHVLRWNGMRDLAALGLVRRGWGRQLAVGFAVGLGLMLAVLGLRTGAGQYTIVGFAPAAPALYWLFANLAGAGWTAVSEELLYRGYLNQAFAGAWPPVWTYLGTALIFAAIHIDTQGASPVRLSELALTAVIYMAVLRATGSLWFAVGAHWSWNTFNVWILEKDLFLQKIVAPGSAWGRYSLLLGLAVLLLSVPLITRYLGAGKAGAVRQSA